MTTLRLIPACGTLAFSVLLGACAVVSPPAPPAPPAAAAAAAAAAPVTQPPKEVMPSAAPAKAGPPSAKAPAPAAPPKAPVALAKPPAAASKPPPAIAAAPAAPPIDLKSLEVKLKESKAIGLMTKLSLKNQVDDLVAQFKAFHDGRRPPTLPELRQPYELLLMKVLSLVQDQDPGLAKALHDSRDYIWSVLSDRDKFLKNV